MQHPIRMKIIDQQSVLTELDRHQVENMIWLCFAPFQQNIDWVKLVVSSLSHPGLGHKHVVQSVVKLASGKVVESSSTGNFKGSVLMSSIDLLKDLAEKRMRFESGWLYRCLVSIRSRIRRSGFTRVKVHVAVSNAQIKRCS